MPARRSAGSWMSGAFFPADRGKWPGEQLGLPESGAGSAASIARRLGALLVDWLLCGAVAQVLLHSRNWTPLVFLAVVAALTGLTGLTVGMRLFGVRVARLDGKPVGLWAIVRTVLLITVIPALIFDADLRGLHDKAANTIVVRL